MTLRDNPYKPAASDLDPADLSPKKVCSTCGQNISTSARKCPWCHETQGRHRTTQQVTQLLVPLGIVVVALVVGYIFFNFERSRPTPSANNYAGAISIVNSRVVQGQHDGNKAIWIAGTLRNNSSAELSTIKLSGKLLNADGELITVLRFQESIRIPPGEEFHFQIDGRHVTSFEEEVASHEVDVDSAWGK